MKANEQGIALGFDCGFVPCMFGKEHYELLWEELKKAGTCCHPIIDMLSDGTFISCYPLHSLYKIKLTGSLKAGELIDEFQQQLLPYSAIGIYPHCSSCPLFGKRCNGGCMAYRIQRYTTH
jgi:radical SAM protein with 4Fe4S-binding SPASM domain